MALSQYVCRAQYAVDFVRRVRPPQYPQRTMSEADKKICRRVETFLRQRQRLSDNDVCPNSGTKNLQHLSDSDICDCPTATFVRVLFHSAEFSSLIEVQLNASGRSQRRDVGLERPMLSFPQSPAPDSQMLADAHSNSKK